MRNSNSIALSLTILALSFSLASTAVTRSSYGEFCNDTMKCAGGSWLDCYNGRCACLKQDEMTYDWTHAKCVSKAGERCTFAVSQTDTDVSSPNFVFEVAACVSNANCSPRDGICKCDNRTHNLEGDCAPSHGRLQHCDETHKCSEYQGLVCKDGICDCDYAKSVYFNSTVNLQDAPVDDFDQRESQCVGLVGSLCINSRCTQHSKCSARNICTCENGYFSDPQSNLCIPQRTIHQNCSGNGECGMLSGVPLVCLDGKCDCDPHFSTYSTAQISRKSSVYTDFYEFEGLNITQCVGIAGSSCIDRLCTPNAFCFYKTSRFNDFSGDCKCLRGHTESRFHTCGIGYGYPCTPYTCIDGLVCQNSLCSCPFSRQIYDDESKFCFSLVGGPCSPNASLMAYSHTNHTAHYHDHVHGDTPGVTNVTMTRVTTHSKRYIFGCGVGAECKPMHGKQYGYGYKGHRGSHCLCQQGFVENEFGFCKGTFGSNCTSVEDCDSVSALQCIDGTCQCKSFAEYKERTRKCVGLVGAKCDVHLKHECTDNAHCSPDVHPKLPGICVCNQGFDENANYTCEHNPRVHGVLIDF